MNLWQLHLSLDCMINHKSPIIAYRYQATVIWYQREFETKFRIGVYINQNYQPDLFHNNWIIIS